MKSSRISTILLSAVVALLFYTSCQKTEAVYEVNTLNLPSRPLDYVTNLNGNQNNRLNPTTNDGATLGRVLFYDKNLSINNTISCASCHKQANGFADVTATSEGYKGGRTTRNSLALVNLADDSRFFSDMRTSSLEELALQPVANHIEMGLENIDNLVKKLNRTAYYPNLFLKAFGSTDINQDLISKALAQFLRSIVSTDSKFDAFRNGGWGTFNEKELSGWDLFFNKLHCSGCHNGNDLNSFGSGNIGLNMDYQDNGAGALLGEPSLNGVFKVPTLRNIALTAPYMHDGRFKTLEEVIEHYNSGVQNHVNLSRFLRGFSWQGNGGSANNTQNCWSCGIGTAGTDFKALNLTQTDKENLVAFLTTLTDETLVRDEKFSNPFRK
jgi:cytochrome c peroxidase